MLKHILTSNCNRKCSYCIARNIHQEQKADLKIVEEVYKSLSQNHKEIMLTGGEPLMARHIVEITELARKHFSKIYLTTQNELALYYSICFKMFDAITFSIHDDPARYKVLNGAKVYASVMAEKYFYDLPYILKYNGFSGLTINEDQRGYKVFNECLIHAEPEIEEFSFKINRRGHCMKECIILPDLSLINDFTPYL